MKPQLIIVEGAQGSGKSALTTLLRERLPFTQLVRMSGCPDKKPTGAYKVYRSHKGILDYAKFIKDTGLNIILDRSFITQEVYSNLGYADFSFTDEYNSLLYDLNNLTKYYEVKLILLTCTGDAFRDRLCRDKANHPNAPFRVESSLNQQDHYEGLLLSIISRFPSIHCMVFSTSEMSLTQLVNSII